MDFEIIEMGKNQERGDGTVLELEVREILFERATTTLTTIQIPQD